VAEGVRSDGLTDPGTTGHSAHDASGSVTVQTVTVSGSEDRSLGTLPDGQVDRSGRSRCQRDRDNLAAFAEDRQCSVTSFHAEGFDVRAGCF
jgi:hypothetical protein